MTYAKDSYYLCLDCPHSSCHGLLFLKQWQDESEPYYVSIICFWVRLVMNRLAWFTLGWDALGLMNVLGTKLYA